MHLVTVYPLAKGIRSETLDYFYPKPLTRGTIVSIPIGNRETQAVVAESNPAEQHKAAIRSADYELKRIASSGKQIFFAQFLSAVEEFARFSGVTTGSALQALTPQPLVAANHKLPSIDYDLLLPDVSAPKASLIQDTAHKQNQYLNSIVQSHISDKETVFVCCPTVQQVEQTAQNLDAHTIALTSDQTKTQLLEQWEKAVTKDGPLVIVGTPLFLSLPRADLGRVIVREESNASYKMQSRPFLDKALFARSCAQTMKRQVTLMDAVPRLSTQWEYRNDRITAEFQPNLRRSDSLHTKLIDMKELTNTADSGVQVFASATAKLLRTTKRDNKHVLLFVSRRGRRPFTICNDCGDVLGCPQCGMPLTLVETNSQRQYVCRTCNHTSDSHTRCGNCSSWRLEPLGIGIDFVADILTDNLSEVDVFQVDSDTQTSRSKACETIADFHASESGILLTTQMGINNLQQPVDASAVITADSLLAIPDLSIPQDLFKMLMTIRDYTQDSFLIQTRSSETSIFQQALAGNITDFYKEQINRRQRFSYPPFSYLIKLTVTGPRKRVQKLTTSITKQLSGYDTQVYPTKEDTADKNVLIRIDADNWVDEGLLQILRNLPPAVSIDAHPRSLL